MQKMRWIMVGGMLALWLWAIAPTIAIAQTQSAYQGNQAMGQPASLVAPDPKLEINIYPQPNTRKPRVGFGVNGDPVVVLEQTGSNGGTIWNRIQFADAPDSEGWVQLEYLSIASTDSQAQGNQSNPRLGGYMGNQSGGRSPASGTQNQQQAQPQNYR